MNIHLDISPDMETMVEQQLDFGQIVTGSGLQRVVLGDSNVGIFKIHALQNQTLLLSFDADKELSHTNPAIKATIGANLMASYSNGFNSPINSIPLKSSFTDVIIESSASSSLASWYSIYIYIFGELNIQHIPYGIYTGSVSLTVNYL